MFGWRGRLLRVNLTSGVISNVTPDQTIFKSYLGGRGLGTHLLAAEVPASAAPLSADNKLIFLTGPLIGTLAPNGGRYTVISRTKPEGKIAAASISGNWGPELKFAGWDGIIIEGQAAQPVYLWVSDDAAELRSAGHISGKSVRETTEALIAETHRKAVVSCIGPAGEKAADNSILATDCISAAGGNGIGAVMGAKLLKAVVVRGSRGFRVAQIAEFTKIATDVRAAMTPIAARGAFVCNSVLLADSVAWDKTPPDFKPARTHGCFGCATSFSSFSYDDGRNSLPLTAATGQEKYEDPAAEYKKFVDNGLDFVREKMGVESNSLMDRGPCMVGGYPIVPKLTPGDLQAVLDSAGLCPFLAAGISTGVIAELLSAATGITYSEDEIAQAGRRISDLIGQNA
jgi:aldehyde:ferredoxin oxidoreductase